MNREQDSIHETDRRETEAVNKHSSNISCKEWWDEKRVTNTNEWEEEEVTWSWRSVKGWKRRTRDGTSRQAQAVRMKDEMWSFVPRAGSRRLVLPFAVGPTAVASWELHQSPRKRYVWKLTWRTSRCETNSSTQTQMIYRKRMLLLNTLNMHSQVHTLIKTKINVSAKMINLLSLACFPKQIYINLLYI